MNITIAGTGYVGLSNAVLLDQHHNVVALDVLPAKVEQINRRESPIFDQTLRRSPCSSTNLAISVSQTIQRLLLQKSQA